jgi:poly(A) polymerase
METGEWWTVFADANAETRAAMLLPDTGPKKKRKRKRKNTSSQNAAFAGNNTDA